VATIPPIPVQARKHNIFTSAATDASLEAKAMAIVLKNELQATRSLPFQILFLN
jgi:hypothetical protein